MTKILEKTLKLYTAEVKSIDEDAKTIRFQVSDDSTDRYGEKVKQDWALKNFLKNPTGLWNHKSGHDMQPEDVLANWQDFETVGSKSFATAQFDAENPKAMFVFGQYARRFLRAVSVGFIPHTLEFEDDVPVLSENELLEISFVAIPANANAVALGLKDGSLNRSDAQYMLRSMKDATVQLEEQLIKSKSAPEDGEETHVEELKTEVKALADLITKLGENVTTLSTSVETLSTDVTEVKSTVAELKPIEKTPEEIAAEKLEADKLAKGGENDQPGADGDEFNEDAELTDEVKAQIDAEFDSAEEESN